ncbi:MAG: hypothetical protein A2015_05130 [Spirochaetes bacterium GWF1_31_7]|nr:MAG: hypothetical protein A2Y30_06525 [Spirochaetes bacterium GWE1_32_154]OHD47227.1 MAG: hypothetical protein A2015_05130 [Spirochaetes bacterium GWF1_31_7]OHD52630.1 MAG: hypothetical protein A2Y29_09640 [Spirochaetes bacterium GWE2_31_10]OHD80925.1 MAG: hypothetical protein A2355_00540 [Spirochaetes bacterium RIFOXYB1_FULL_32_8]HBD94295.1 3-hydroxybutyryl-CoA dehydrogenase [Spirochaetia bacterium]
MLKEVKRVLIIGSGTMGEQIALQILKNNYTVYLYDNSKDNLFTCKSKIEQNTTLEQSEKLFITENLTEISDKVDLVIETVTENLKVKKELFRKLNTLFPKEVIFVTNTSDLLPSWMAKDSGREEYFCAYHFHAPMYGADIVDIMPHSKTSIDTIKSLKIFTKRIKLIPLVLKKENPGYIYNTILNSIMDSSIKLVIKGVAEIEDVDRAWMGNTGMKIGPFGMLDLIGIDTAMNVSIIKAKKNILSYIGAAFFKKFVKNGKLGIKTGEGFYKYPNPKYQDENFLRDAKSYLKN